MEPLSTSEPSRNRKGLHCSSCALVLQLTAECCFNGIGASPQETSSQCHVAWWREQWLHPGHLRQKLQRGIIDHLNQQWLHCDCQHWSPSTANPKSTTPSADDCRRTSYHETRATRGSNTPRRAPIPSLMISSWMTTSSNRQETFIIHWFSFAKTLQRLSCFSLTLKTERRNADTFTASTSAPP